MFHLHVCNCCITIRYRKHVPYWFPMPFMFTISGGLFGEEEDPSVENAFKYAVYRINHERHILGKTKLTYDIQRLPVRDSFRASKKGEKLKTKWFAQC